MKYPLLTKEQDGRRKLTEVDKARIIELYQSGVAIRKIAKLYKTICCRRTIQFTLFPERAKETNSNSYLHRMDYPSSSKIKRNQYMRKHRTKKKMVHGYEYINWEKEYKDISRKNWASSTKEYRRHLYWHNKLKGGENI